MFDLDALSDAFRAFAEADQNNDSDNDNDFLEPWERWRLRPIVIAEGSTLACVQNVETTFDAFSYKLRSARPGPKEGSYYTQGKVRGVRRGNKEMCTQSLAVLDVDAGQDPKEIIARAREYGLHVLIHSTHSSTPECPKFRVVVPLDSEVPTDLLQWPRVIKALATLLGAAFDKACTDAGRLFYYPRYPADQMPWCLEAEGAPVRYADLLTLADVIEGAEKKNRQSESGQEREKRKSAREKENGRNEWRDNIRNGVELHESLNRLAMSLAADGRSFEEIQFELESLMNDSTRQQDDPATWQARFNDIPRIVETALSKVENSDSFAAQEDRREKVALMRDAAKVAALKVDVESRIEKLSPADAGNDWLLEAIINDIGLLRLDDLIQRLRAEAIAEASQDKTCGPLCHRDHVGDDPRAVDVDCGELAGPG